MSARRTTTQTVAPAAEPVTLAEAKAWAKVDTTTDDALLAALITAAIESAQQYTRRSFITQTWKLTLDLPVYGWARDLPEGTYDLPVSALSGDLPTVIELSHPPIIAVSSIVTYDTSNNSSTFSSSNYTVNAASGRVFLNDTAYWPSGLRPIASCEITYTAGYGATSSSVPMPIKTAILMHVKAMYDERLVCDMPDSCKHLLNQYKVYEM